MVKVSRYTVVPKLPENLEPLRTIAYNLWWCWDPEGVDLFFRIDRDLWIQTEQNAVRVLGEVTQRRLEELASDESFLAHLERVHSRLQAYMPTEELHEYKPTSKWKERHPNAPDSFHVAYFSAEFGLQESVRIYSGGLGILAGDHLKAASDLGLPLIGVGLLYRQGYFAQYLNTDGWQQERYPQNDFFNIAILLERDSEGDEIIIEVDYPDGPVKVRIWRCQVGRVPLFLLDCDVEENKENDRAITARLYGGDQDTRIRQEILLGMGGIKALEALGIPVTAYHMNEGHSAFLTLQRIKDLMHRKGLTFAQASEAVKSSSVFTTHTPVPAGNDMFAPDKMLHYFKKYLKDVDITDDLFLSLGRQVPSDKHEPFCMTVLAMRLSAASNGVSKLHGEVARGMWSRTWPNVPEDEVPVTSITNGVHIRSYISRELAGLYDRYLGPAWLSNPDDQDAWKRIEEVPDAELWRTHERRRERLVNFARRRLVSQMHQRGASHSDIELAAEVLDPEVLTIGFARRFATYKRANLFLMDPERLVKILADSERPVQMIIAGKAHPADTSGKELIRAFVHFARREDVRNRLVFIENYDINVARYMVQGVDCWLNTPRRPMEASGTSGMKAAANGALNISIPDGWWCEAELSGENGWSIGSGEEYNNTDEQDIVESEMLYEILEKEAVPAYYERSRDGLPRKWIRMMKNSIFTCCPVYNTNRMVEEYTDRFYLPCTLRSNDLIEEDYNRTVELATWKEKTVKCWGKIKISDMKSGPAEGLPYGSSLQVTADVFLDELTDDDVTVEIYYGDLNRHGQIEFGQTATMDCIDKQENGVFTFEGAIVCNQTGQHGFTVRVIPSHPDLAQKHETMLITWAK